TILEIIGRVRCNVLISGGTGSGKTTLLNCLTGYIDLDERVITCEDAAELQLQQPHVVRLETRPPNLEGEGEITMRDLVKNWLRMRPERMIVGEDANGKIIGRHRSTGIARPHFWDRARYYNEERRLAEALEKAEMRNDD